MFTIRMLGGEILGKYTRDEIYVHLLQLDTESNRLRFGSFMNEDAIKKYVNSIDFNKDRVYGAYDNDNNLVGVIHIAWMKQEGCAEIGISVDKSVRNGGIGGKLFKKAINYARMHGAKRLYSFCLTENTAMMHLAKKENMKVERFANEAEAHMVIEPATPDIYFNEYSDEVLSQTEFITKYINNAVIQAFAVNLEFLKGRNIEKLR